MSGRSPSSASGKQSPERPTPLPGSHSSVPCLPTCTIASAPQPPSAARRRQPAIERGVVMRRRQIRRVIDRVGIHAVAARRLQRDERAGRARSPRTDSRPSSLHGSLVGICAPAAALDAIFLSTRRAGSRSVSPRSAGVPHQSSIRLRDAAGNACERRPRSGGARNAGRAPDRADAARRSCRARADRSSARRSVAGRPSTA